MHQDHAEQLAWVLVEDFSTVSPMSQVMREELEERFLYILLNYCSKCERVYCYCDD